MSTEIKKILEETGSINVEQFYFDKVIKKWIITYKNNLKRDEFELFGDAYDFLKNG